MGNPPCRPTAYCSGADCNCTRLHGAAASGLPTFLTLTRRCLRAAGWAAAGSGAAVREAAGLVAWGWGQVEGPHGAGRMCGC